VSTLRHLPSGAVAGAVVLAIVGAAVDGAAVHQGLWVCGALVGLPDLAFVGFGVAVHHGLAVVGAAVVGPTVVAGLAVVGDAVGLPVTDSNRKHSHRRVLFSKV
jgi:hypothetical protein